MKIASGKVLCGVVLVAAATGWSTIGVADAPIARLTRVAAGLSGPTALVAPADGSGRLFIVENKRGEGRVRIIDAQGKLLAAPYYTHAITGGPGSEQGMLGLAFDPQFASNGTLYITYTAPGSDPMPPSTAAVKALTPGTKPSWKETTP